MIKGLHHNAYRCRDSEETRTFYEGFLGLPLVNAFKIETTMTGRKTGAGVLHSFYQLDDGSCLAFFEAPDMPFEFKQQHDFDLHIALEVDPEAKEVFVADGYGNRRVIVFDSETGAFKRYWGAYGHKPNDDKQPAYDPAAAPSQQFGNPVHCAKPSKDGLLYVCDRTNNRIQVFKKDGTFVTEWFYDKPTLGAGAVWDLNFWPDANQTWLLNLDGENNQLRVLQRSDGKVVGGFGRSGRQAGNFHWVHAIAVDSRGNVYTGEVDNAKRVQKFKPDRAP